MTTVILILLLVANIGIYCSLYKTTRPKAAQSQEPAEDVQTEEPSSPPARRAPAKTKLDEVKKLHPPEGI